jgi:hypothetical protein
MSSSRALQPGELKKRFHSILRPVAIGSLLFFLTGVSFAFVVPPTPIVTSLYFESYVLLESIPDTLLNRIAISDLSRLKSGESRVHVSATYDSQANTIVSKIDIVNTHSRSNRSKDALHLLSFLASVDRTDSYEAPPVTTVVFTGHITDTGREDRSVLAVGAPVVLSFQTARRGSNKLLDVVEMLPGISFAPTVISGRVTLPKRTPLGPHG